MHLSARHKNERVVASINPANGRELQTYRFQTAEEVESILSAAEASFQRWRLTPIAERCATLGRFADQIEAQREDLARLIVREMGKPISEAHAEVDKCVASSRHFVEKGPSYLTPDPLELGVRNAYVSFEPLGAVLAIMPWNYPLWQFVRFFASAFVAGNVAILKHAENVQGCATALVNALEKAGGEPGLLQNLLIERDEIGRVIADDRIAAVTFTGSVRAGRIVAGLAGQAGKKSVLELGGSDPFIVLRDADIDKAVATGVQARFMNAGQSCICSKRFVVVDEIYDDFVDAFTSRTRQLRLGDPMLPGTQIGAIARADLRDSLSNQLRASLAQGARMALPGGAVDGPGYFFSPVVLTDVPSESTAAREELFGPVASFFRVKDEDEAVQKANATRFGLGASIWTKDLERAARIVPRIEAGAVFVNDLVRSVAGAPFGGIKDSGYGRELGQLGTREFTNQKLVWING